MNITKYDSKLNFIYKEEFYKLYFWIISAKKQYNKITKIIIYKKTCFIFCLKTI